MFARPRGRAIVVHPNGRVNLTAVGQAIEYAAKEGSMLTLTRKAGQKIRIGDNIEIVVREIRGRQVRLGISAPEGLEVFREELYQQILAEAENPDAAGTPPDRDKPEDQR
jgi:carbon storage regulator